VNGKDHAPQCAKTLVSLQVECVGPCKCVRKEEESMTEGLYLIKTIFEK